MNLTYCWKNYWVVPLLVVGVFVASAFLFISMARAAEEAQVQAAIEDLSSATGQDITSEDQARIFCNQEQYLDVCADIGKNHDLYTPEELKHVDDFLGEVKGKILDDIKSCANEECLVKVATELAQKIKTKNPTLATSLNLTTTVVAEKQAVVQAAKDAGVNFKDCESMDPDTASVDLLRKCAKLAKDTRVQKYIPEDRRALADQFGDTTIKLREGLSTGKYQCGDGTLEGCGNFCLNPDAATRATGMPAVCTQIASEIFGKDGVKQLESSYQQVGQVKDYYSKKFILTLPNGKELVGENQIKNACDQAFSGRNLEIARACGSFAVQNGFVTQVEVDQGLKLMESFTQKGQNTNFDQCLTNPTSCREFIPEDDRGRFDAGNQIFEIMKTEIGFDPSQCERGSTDQAIGTKCFEGSKRALAKIESLGLANQSREARFIIEDVKRHVTEGESFISKKDEFQQVFSQQGGPGGCKSEAECFTYCSNPTNGAECISFGSKQNISGFRGQEAVQKFEEYNYNLQRPGLVSDEYRPFSPGGQYPQFPGQGPYPGFQPPGQGGYVPGQYPGFTQPGPGYNNPPPGVGGFYPGPGPAGPSPECFAAIQSGDFARAKTACTSSGPSIPFPTGQVCPASPYVECPAGQYHESYRNPDGCWVDGPCKLAPTYSSGPYPTYTYSPPPGGYQCSDGRDNDNDGKTDYPADTSCYGLDDSDEYYPPEGGIYPPYPTTTGGTGTMYSCFYPNATINGKQPGYTVWCEKDYYNCHQGEKSGAAVSLDGLSLGAPSSCESGYQGQSCNNNKFCDSNETYTSCPSDCGGATYTPYPTGGKPQCSDGLDNDNDGKTDYPADISCYGPDDWDEYYPTAGTSPYPTYTPGPSCPSGQWWDYTQNKCSFSGPYPTYSPGPGTGSCSQYLISLLGDGCHQMYTDSSGRLIFCDGPMSKSAKEGDTTTTAGCSSGTGTYSPYPSPSASSCPSGYHYHDASGGYCMNDQENYGGTCYNSAGTSKIPCPGQASYTPTPSCPSGQWWDYAKNVCTSTTTTYTPAPSCPSGQWWDYAKNVCTSTTTTYTPAPSCPSGQWWDYAKNVCVSSTTSYTPYPSCSSGVQWTVANGCSPAPTYTYTPTPSCPSGQWWDYAKNMCVSSTTSYLPYPTSSDYTYTPAPSCPSGQWWDYASSSCKSNTSTVYCGNYICDSGETSATCPSDCGGGTTYTPYPTTTYTYTPPPSCSSTQYWNGTSCVENVTTTYTPYPTTEYHPPESSHSPPPTSGLNSPYMVAHCQQLGRTWNGKTCQANGLFARFYENNVANVLRAFYIVP